MTKPHGYLFDVPAFGTCASDGAQGDGPFQPRGGRRRSRHRLSSTRPRTPATPGFYRFVPASSGQPRRRRHAGDARHRGRAQLQHQRQPGAGRAARCGVGADWQSRSGRRAAEPVRARGAQTAAPSSSRLEGAWWSHGKAYFVSTSGGNVGQGQIWEYEPCSETLTPGLRVAGRRGSQRARQHLCKPARRLHPVRGRLRHRVPPRSDRRRQHLPVRAEQRRPGRPAQRVQRRLPRQRVRRRDLQPRRPLAVRQRSESRHYVRHHRALAQRGALGACSGFLGHAASAIGANGSRGTGRAVCW